MEAQQHETAMSGRTGIMFTLIATGTGRNCKRERGRASESVWLRAREQDDDGARLGSVRRPGDSRGAVPVADVVR